VDEDETVRGPRGTTRAATQEILNTSWSFSIARFESVPEIAARAAAPHSVSFRVYRSSAWTRPSYVQRVKLAARAQGIDFFCESLHWRPPVKPSGGVPFGTITPMEVIEDQRFHV